MVGRVADPADYDYDAAHISAVSKLNNGKSSVKKFRPLLEHFPSYSSSKSPEMYPTQAIGNLLKLYQFALRPFMV